MNLLVFPQLPANSGEEAAILVHSALSEYYALFGLDRGLILASIERQLHQPSEIERVIAAVVDDRVVGLACYYPVDEMEQRQMASLVDLMTAASDRRAVTKRVRDFARQIPPLSESGLYLARLAVGPAYFGSGVAKNLMDALEEETRRQKLGLLSLHVNRANARAVAFYQKCGFVFGEGPMADFAVMKKDCGLSS